MLHCIGGGKSSGIVLEGVDSGKGDAEYKLAACLTEIDLKDSPIWFRRSPEEFLRRRGRERGVGAPWTQPRWLGLRKEGKDDALIEEQD